MEDEQAFVRTSWVNLLGNLLKLLVEGGIGLAFGSLALVANAANSLGDVLASLIILIWGRLTYADPDAAHPHGHERIEPLAALVIGVIVLAVGARLLFESVQTLLETPEGTFTYLLLIALGIGISIKSVQYLYTHHVARRIDSSGLRALAADALTDIYASGAAVVGVLGYLIGYPSFDPLAGAVVSLLVLREGGTITHENIEYLVGHAPPKETQARIRTVARAHPAVKDIHDVRAYYIGPEIEVELHAEVNADRTFQEAHDLEMELMDHIQEIDHVKHVHLHLDPIKYTRDRAG